MEPRLTLIKARNDYQAGNPTMSDAEYDRLEKEFSRENPNNSVLTQVGAKAGKVAHDIPMLSLKKVYKTEDVTTWKGIEPVLGMFKFDGVALKLIYENGKLKQALTRGNGHLGEDVTHVIRHIEEIAIPENINPLGQTIVIGELICNGKPFEKLKEEMDKRGLDIPSNSRNATAGILSRKDHLNLAEFLYFIAFDLQGGFYSTYDQKLKALSQMGFPTPECVLIETTKQLNSFINKSKKYKDLDGYIPADGIVFVINNIKSHHSMGFTSHHPRFKLAFKWESETAVSSIQKIEWNLSQNGVLTPVAVIEPVELSGATISRLTLHNAATVAKHNLNTGASIMLTRAGEVIPKFLGSLKSGAKFKFPRSCPSCGGDTEYYEPRLICRNFDCSDRLCRELETWVKHAGIEGLGFKTIQKIVRHTSVMEASDLYDLTVDEINFLGEKSANKIIASVQHSAHITPLNFLLGLGIPGMGRSSWENVLKKYSLEDLDYINQGSWIYDGFTRKSFYYFQEKVFLITKLKRRLCLIRESEDNQSLSGQSFVITGTLSVPRKELVKKLESMGASISGSVSQSTTAVICNDPAGISSKLVKARKLGIKIMPEADLFS